ncbi:MAG: bifunctional (p)ppGpp synthetase/guanosine-3',5'-bis(diphosphate) 3'-pyrophosphohydrolase [Anaerolineae bacterium]|nr:bifunctional (p)ppGpp synthetase/guanosine-3',5'-bis(diphosphate) 3'-pyrophosphohydrolase [Anaerolineae bacterium]
MKQEAIGIEQLLASLPKYYTDEDREIVKRAYELASIAHANQKRASGEPYINHCVAVAGILSDLYMSADAIAAGLLHDVVEDTDVTLQEIREKFGASTSSLVDGVTKLEALPRVSHNDQEDLEDDEAKLTEEQLSRRKKLLGQETLRKTMLAMNKDVRVIVIKLADRLHNMRTLSYTKPEKQRRIARETLEIYAPIANRIGIGEMKWELEDLSLYYLEQEKYKEIAAGLNERRAVRTQQMEKIKKRLAQSLADAGIQAEVSGRPKHIYSIYKKMIGKDRSFDQIMDVRGVRLLVEDKSVCYATLGIIHSQWRPIPGEFDDYIAAPKENMYQSLHTAVMYEDNKPLEVQIRTHEMHQHAERGIAAHWRYKEASKQRDEQYESFLSALRNQLDIKNEDMNADEFIETMKNDVFDEHVYVFTPKGDIIDLPKGSTPIDFAYHVHTDVGHRCRGAKINGKLEPLNYVLKTGDRVVILTTKQGGPSRDWLNPSIGLVKTQRARAKIRVWLKKQAREHNLAQGRQMLEREFHRLGLDEINLENLARQLEYRNPDDMFVALGCGDLSVSRIINLISDQKTPEDIIETSAPKSETASSDAVAVRGLRGLLTQMAKCCNPTPGDPIVGYITRGRGATIHRADCPNILRSSTNEKERLVRVAWGDAAKTYPVPIRITAFDRQGLMNDISNLLNNEGVNITDVNVRVNHDSLKADIANIRLIVEVRDLVQLSRVLNRMENLSNVLEAQRSKAG